MKKLETKTFYSIFTILSLFVIVILAIFNFQNYHKELLGIENNLKRMNNIIFSKNKKNDNFPPNLENKNVQDELNNKIIMDYEVYSILLDDNNNIIEIINHSDSTLKNDITNIAEDIIKKPSNNTIKINNLYFSKYSYNFQNGKFLVIVDTTTIRKRLLSIATTSMILLIISEIIIYYISKLITNWITKPALDSFEKQKEFIADASHELKTPLSVIMASADALETDINEKKWLNNIKTETEKMNHLISSLLDLSKIESNNRDFDNVNLSKIIEKMTLTFESLAYENKLSITTNIEKNIIFKCNSNEINELISILIDNAIKHSDKLSKIKVILSKQKDEIVLEVINKGEPIPKEECEKIFERFYRIDKSRNRNSGRYGLGLAIAKSIVQKHNGKITASSDKGYTTFKVILKNKEH